MRAPRGPPPAPLLRSPRRHIHQLNRGAHPPWTARTCCGCGKLGSRAPVGRFVFSGRYEGCPCSGHLVGGWGGSVAVDSIHHVVRTTVQTGLAPGSVVEQDGSAAPLNDQGSQAGQRSQQYSPQDELHGCALRDALSDPGVPAGAMLLGRLPPLRALRESDSTSMACCRFSMSVNPWPRSG